MDNKSMLMRVLFFWCGLLLILPSLASAGQLGQGTGSSYPTTLDTKTTFTDKVSCNTTITTRVCSATPNDLQAAIVNIETELGLLPKGSYATVVARLNAAAYLTTANTFTATQTLSLATPSFIMTDTTVSAKSLTVAVGANVANFRESAGASGSLLALDLANNRVGIGTASPSNRLVVYSDGDTPQIRFGFTDSSNQFTTIGRLNSTGYTHFIGAQTTFSGFRFFVDNTTEVLSILNSGFIGIRQPTPNVGLEMGATLNVRIPNIKAVTGVRFVCVDINGTLTSQAAACSGT